MNGATCPREHELLDSLGRGFVGAELKSHVAECPSCRELDLIAGGLLEVRNDAVTHARIPASGTMLWRMQMRKRHDAQVATRRTLLAGQALTLMIAIAITIAVFGADIAMGVRAGVARLQALDVNLPLVLAVATSVLLAPIAGWVMARQK